ncbi:MAG: DUF4258 domain-containing protein [Betaproteobacteria bacterium]|nr:DUF4258 domain-containing protein [Betaproteobacteria bacterium]
MNDADMLQMVRRIAANSDSIFFGPHSLKRMKRRHITRMQVIASLRQGSIEESAHKNIRGNWQCTLRHLHAGDLVRVAAAIEKDDNGAWIAVITVF